MNIEQILKEANRYDAIQQILKDIVADNQQTYPVDPFIDNDHKTKWRVDGDNVRKDAKELLRIIDNNEAINTDFLYLTQYVRTKSDALLHNYAVSISHRNEPKIDMEKIRCWEILDNLLTNCCNGQLDDDWYIPTGWKKL